MNRQWNVVECPECGGSGKVTREAEAARTADRPSLREAAVALEKVAVAPDALMNDNDPAGRELRSWWLERFGPALAALRQALEGSDADLRSEDEG